MKRKAFLVHTGRGDSYEFWGVLPDWRAADTLASRQIGGGYVELRTVTRDELERIKEDDVTDAEWEAYSHE